MDDDEFAIPDFPEIVVFDMPEIDMGAFSMEPDIPIFEPEEPEIVSFELPEMDTYDTGLPEPDFSLPQPDFGALGSEPEAESVEVESQLATFEPEPEPGPEFAPQVSSLISTFEAFEPEPKPDPEPEPESESEPEPEPEPEPQMNQMMAFGQEQELSPFESESEEHDDHQMLGNSGFKQEVAANQKRAPPALHSRKSMRLIQKAAGGVLKEYLVPMYSDEPPYNYVVAKLTSMLLTFMLLTFAHSHPICTIIYLL